MGEGLWNLTGVPRIIQENRTLVEPSAFGRDLMTRGCPKEAPMTDWRDQMVDRPETDNAAYAAGWTVSGLAVLGTIVAIWVFGI